MRSLDKEGRIERWRRYAERCKVECYALYFAYRDPRVSRLAKIIIACILAYALSPIDLIPDFIPVLGYVDDLVLIPLGIWLAVKLVPETILEEYRAIAKRTISHKSPKRSAGAVFIVILWFLISVLFLKMAVKFYGR